MIDKIIDGKLNKKGLKLLYWDEPNGSKGMWVVATIENRDALSIHFDLEGVVERWLRNENHLEPQDSLKEK